MHIYRWFILMSIVILSFSTALARTPVDENSIPDKAMVMDGHMVHTLGNLASNVTNWGLIGSKPSMPSSFSDSPSAMWPAGSGNEYLWGAGLWVGGIVNGEPLVSTGFSSYEILPTTAPGDTIFHSFQGASGGNWFPWAGADDDGDGLEDEDPLDGIDNDLDGWIDEDFAAIGDQYYRCSMADNTPAGIQMNPNHTPLNIKVTQQSFQWSDPLTADFIGYQYTITNIGEDSIDEIYCGLFSDFDIGPRGSIIASDDLAGSFEGSVQASDGTFVTVSMGYMYDGSESNRIPGYCGWVMCGFETDAVGGLSDNSFTFPSLQIYSGSRPYENGGDPTNDAQRYEVMSSGDWDEDALPGRTDDYRIVMSSSAVPVLNPGESVTFRVALVLGDGMADMLGHAAEAVVTAIGKNYDRNGVTVNVPWLRPNEGLTPVPGTPFQSTVLHEAVPNPFNPITTISFELPKPANVTLRVFDMSGRLVDVLMDDETASEGLNKVIWSGKNLTGFDAAAGVYFYSLETDSFRETKRMTLVK